MKKDKKEKLTFFRMLRRLLPLVVGACPVYFAVNALISILHGVSFGFTTFVSQIFYDGVAKAVGQHAVTAAAVGGAFALFGATVLCQALNGISNFMTNAMFTKISGRLGKLVNAKASRIDPVAFETTGMLDDINKAGEGKENSTGLVFTFLVIFLFYLPYFAFMGAYLFLLEPVLALSVVIIFLPVAASQVIRSSVFTKLADKSAPVRREYEYYEKCICDRDYFKETRLLGAFSYFRDLYRLALKLLNGEIWKAERKTGLLEIAMKLLTLVGYVGVLWLLVRALLRGSISIGAFAAVFSSIGMMIGIMEEIICQHIGSMTKNLGTVRNFLRFLDLPERGGADTAVAANAGFEFKDVTFRYPGAKEDSLRHVSLTVKPGETVAVVGENGAGKSTLVRLLTGLYLPSSGQVDIGGVDTRAVSPVSFYRGISGVFQKYQRYRMTLRDNIRISSMTGDDGDVEKAAEKADLSLDTDSFPKRLDTMLSREFDGVDLSGGQWQRVAIARGFHRAHGIVVLDEPTAAIDPIEETNVYRKFAEISKGKTAVIVTHRLGSARIADRIIVMERGRVAEVGTHDELLAAGGVYAEMFGAQAKWYVM